MASGLASTWAYLVQPHDDANRSGGVVKNHITGHIPILDVASSHAV